MKKSFLMMLIAAAMVSCAQTEINEAPATGKVAIQLKSAEKTISADATRAPFIGTLSELNPLEARVLASITIDDYSTPHANGKMIFKGGGTTSSYEFPTVTADAALFPTSSISTTPLYLAGLYPYTGWGIPTTTIQMAFTGKEDVMAAAQVSTTSGDVESALYTTMTFKHLLTKLEISLRAKTNAATSKWGKVTKIELVEANSSTLKNVATVTLETGIAAFSGTPSVMPFYGMSSSGYTDVAFSTTPQSLTTTATPSAYSIIAPFLASNTETDLTFRVYTEYSASPETVKVALPSAGDTAGKAFNITFTFDADANAILVAATVIDWVFGGEVDKEIGGN